MNFSGSWSFSFARFLLFLAFLLVARYWVAYREFSQTILLIVEVLVVITKLIESIIDKVNFGSVHICILCMSFATNAS